MEDEKEGGWSDKWEKENEESVYRAKRFQLVCAIASNSIVVIDHEWVRYWHSADAILAAEPPIPERKS